MDGHQGALRRQHAISRYSARLATIISFTAAPAVKLALVGADAAGDFVTA
jgi:hypothetical protein